MSEKWSVINVYKHHKNYISKQKPVKKKTKLQTNTKLHK